MRGLARLAVFRCQLSILNIWNWIKVLYTVVSLFTGMQCLANFWIDIKTVEYLSG